MRDKDQKNMCETKAETALAMSLMSALILTIIIVFARLVPIAVSENRSLDVLLRGSFLP